MINIELVRQHVPKAVIRYAVPSIIAMLLTSAISIIDGYFIGNYIGQSALTAVSLGLPINYICLAVGIMIGVGGVSQASRLLGAQKIEQSICVFNQTALTGMVALLVLALLLLALLNPIGAMFHVNNPVRIHFSDYYSLMISVYPFAMLNVILGMFVHSEGKPVVYMLLSTISVILNTALDYLFVTYTECGIQGIALASVISILVGSSYMLGYFKFKSKVYIYQRFTFSRDILLNTFKNGSSEFIGQCSMCITTITMNYMILREGGVCGVTAFTVVGYFTYTFTMIVIGFGQGAGPLISFVYGANEYGLVKRIRDLTMLYVFVLGCVAMLSITLNADGYSHFFVDNAAVERMIITGIPVYSSVFLFMGINIITSFYFTCVGNAKASALISASRGLVILLLSILIFPTIMGMKGVWVVAPVTEALTLLISFFLLNKSYKLTMM